MDDDLRRHLTEMLAHLRPLTVMAERHGVPGRTAGHLRAAAFEIDDTLDPGAAERRASGDRECMDIIRQREREGGVWGIDEA
jgi:hypothetical protein